MITPRPTPGTRSRRLLPVVLLVGLLAACRPVPEIHQAQFYVFGTLVDVSVQGVSEATANGAFEALQQDFQRMHRDWHAWEPGLLHDVNEAFAAGLPAVADRDIVRMVEASQRLEQLSGGRFNPAIGALIELWGFHTSDYPIVGPPPAPQAIDALVRQHPSSRDIRIDGLTLSSENTAVQLDFGGIAKGYAIDLACARLRSLGIEDAIVNAGGDLRAIGSHGDRPWRIAVRDPRGGIVGSLETGPDEAVFTSGNYERYREDEAERYPHILDPRNGWPVTALSSVTVIADQGLLADAAATALIVAGPSEWAETARSMGLDQVLVIDAQGRAFLTPAMAKRVSLVASIQPEVTEVAR
jgi:thiamine biosynthesis lipoprotein